MPEQARTVGVALGLLGIEPWGPPGVKVSTEVRRIFDYHIIPGADAVVTEEGLEASAKAIADSFGIAWTPENDVEKNTLRHEARAALEAAGIVVADKVMKCSLEPRNWGSDGHAHDVGIFPSDPASAELCKRAEFGECVRMMVLFSDKEKC